MNEFIKKLIGRLEEFKRASEDDYIGLGCEDDFGAMNAYGHAIEIVNKLAEECAKDTNIQTIDVSELLGEQVNDGWIPCSERLPEERFFDDGYVEPSDKVLVFTKYGDYKTSRYWGNRRNKRYYYDWLDIDYRKDEVLAWQPLPAPYQPKGEQ